MLAREGFCSFLFAAWLDVMVAVGMEVPGLGWEQGKQQCQGWQRDGEPPTPIPALTAPPLSPQHTPGTAQPLLSFAGPRARSCQQAVDP